MRQHQARPCWEHPARSRAPSSNQQQPGDIIDCSFYDPRDKKFAGGAKGDGIADDRAPLQAAIDAAFADRASFKPSGSGAVYTDDTPTVFIHGARYRLGAALSVPSACRIVALGTASFEPSGMFPAIKALSAYQLYIDGINFIGGSSAVVIQNDNTESTMIDFVNCEFKTRTEI
ncbi:hypothetical protein [Massilia sp. DWR3-1-1]|uniref:hypothetical protein n=1 Tax=Massilia sp. DWR3-1-1 TaxID=2804559 RepID=UPI003CEF3941